MTTAQMKYFLTAAQQKNFTAAAEMLYITQPSLSRQIAAIENELGVPLFRRVNNVVTLTLEGEALYQRLSALYADYSRMVDQVKAVHEGNVGRLNIGLLDDQLLDQNVIQAMDMLQRANPGIHINLMRKDSYSLFGGLQDDTLDLAIMLIYDELLEKGLNGLPLSESIPYLAISRKKAEKSMSRIVMKDLTTISERLPVIMAALESFPPPIRESLEQFPPIAPSSIPQSNVRFVTQVGAIPLYVTAGMGVTLANAQNILHVDPNVLMIPVVDGPIMTQGMLWREDCSNPLVPAQLVLLREKNA